MATPGGCFHVVDASLVAAVVKSPQLNGQDVVIVDCRSIFDYNACHIRGAVSMPWSRLMRKRLQQNNTLVLDMLMRACQRQLDSRHRVVLYDDSTSTLCLPSDRSLIDVLVSPLADRCITTLLLYGGFTEFKAKYPTLCTSSEMRCVADQKNHPHHSSLSQPCLPVSNVGPTRILPFLFLGSQLDSMSRETMLQNGITYVLNVSTSSPKPPFVPDEHFMRIPINDNYSEKLAPYLHKAFKFLDKVREANGCVLIHCLAGISRSPTVAIAYVMRVLGMNSDEAYRYVKDKRPTISPNFNFLGQLLEFEKELRSIPVQLDRSGLSEATSVKKQRMDVSSGARLDFELSQPATVPGMISPVTAFSQLNFNQLSPLCESPTADDRRTIKAGNSLPVASGIPTSTLSSCGVVIRLGSKHSHGGLKRPLSGPPCDTRLDQSFDCGSAKRPLARPRSITLPSTIQPLHALSVSTHTNSVQASARLGHNCPPLTAAADSEDHTGNIPTTSAADCLPQMTVDQCTINSADIKTAVEKVLLQLESDDRPVLIARKSRSTENILSSPDASASNVDGSRPSSGKLPPMHFPCDVPTYSCHEASNAETPRHPGSGLSSSGSHTSLIDSPEIISVS